MHRAARGRPQHHPTGRAALPVDLAPRPESARIARGLVAEALSDVPDECRDVAVLLTDELVANAVVHGRGPLSLSVQRHPASVEVRVHDGSNDPPIVAHARSDDISGRGLAMVSALASAWGVQPMSSGKLVWFRVDLPPDPGRQRPGLEPR